MAVLQTGLEVPGPTVFPAVPPTGSRDRSTGRRIGLRVLAGVRTHLMTLPSCAAQDTAAQRQET
ncbi:hypothetical protein GCM10009665_43690 [Kitasatospora nipponensis]|uniref:Uncharacterized protein n=1 Tax=Kitasatospora nipponensis TaxID=258049 RepID=A0ABN1WEN5_9ACTN